MKIFATIMAFAVLFFACAACTSQSSTPSITFKDDRCTYSGADSIQADQFAFTWVNNSQQYAPYFVIAIQVEEGQSVDDLVGLPIESTPSWVSSLKYERSTQPGPWTKELTWDLTGSARFQPGPVYFMCVHNETETFGVAGPVEAKE